MPQGFVIEDRLGNPLPKQVIVTDKNGGAMLEVKTAEAKPERAQPECLIACESGLGVLKGSKIDSVGKVAGGKAPTNVYILRDSRDPVKGL